MINASPSFLPSNLIQKDYIFNIKTRILYLKDVKLIELLKLHANYDWGLGWRGIFHRFGQNYHCEDKYL